MSRHGQKGGAKPIPASLRGLGGSCAGKETTSCFVSSYCDGQVSDPLAKASSRWCPPSELSRLIKKRIVLFSVPVSHNLISQGETSRPGVRASVKHCIQKTVQSPDWSDLRSELGSAATPTPFGLLLAFFFF